MRHGSGVKSSRSGESKELVEDMVDPFAFSGDDGDDNAPEAAAAASAAKSMVSLSEQSLASGTRSDDEESLVPPRKRKR